MKRLLTYTHLLWGLFFLGSFLFFELNYRYWYRFMEQYSLFLYTEDYFLGLLKQPGGFNEYLTAFITQFFIFPYAAPLSISLLLTLISILFARTLSRAHFQLSTLHFPLLTLFPAFLFWLFPVESIASILAALTGVTAVAVYVSVDKPWQRYLAGFLLLTLTYFLSAPAHLLAAAGMLVCEWGKSGRSKGWLPALGWFVWALILPLLAMRTLYVVPMREAFLSKHLFHPEYPIPLSFWYVWCSFPLVAGVIYGLGRRKAWFGKGRASRLIQLAILGLATGLAILYGEHPLEQVYYYDCLARRQAWQAIVEHAAKHAVKDKDALIYANLAHAYTGTFNEALLRLPQIGDDGLIPYDPKTRLGLIEAAEVSYLLNHTNSAQRFAFVGVLSSERNVQPRLMQRLVETYLVNEEYKAAEKYIRILEKSAFYRAWAKELSPLLVPETAQNTSWIAERRRLNPVTDNPYDLTKTLPNALAFLIDDHPDNKSAFEYGMGYLLLYKDLGAFMHYMEGVNEKGEDLPILYQEAICLYYTAVQNNPEAFRSYAIAPAVYQRFRGYLQQVRTLSPSLLARQYGDTYYYYAQFVQPPNKPAR
ncbi:MAG: DUF6057 family protein [Tannerellaceae bacterium]|jgi:hypothetical protein|nr:DUF6057 family protein [Tannerellaceae bacterium]